MGDFTQRAVSSAALLTLVAFAAWWDEASFAMLCAIGFWILLREWRGLTRSLPSYGSWLVAGVLYFAAGAASLIYIRYESLPILAAVIAIVVVGDSAAYLVGRKIGKHKIIPRISPGKSWEGLIASILASAATGAILGHVAPVPHAILGALFAVLGFGGDLFESWLKRRAGVKDSGTLLPGHGGLFDRVDALLPCAIFGAIALYARLHLQ